VGLTRPSAVDFVTRLEISMVVSSATSFEPSKSDSRFGPWAINALGVDVREMVVT